MPLVSIFPKILKFLGDNVQIRAVDLGKFIGKTHEPQALFTGTKRFEGLIKDGICKRTVTPGTVNGKPIQCIYTLTEKGQRMYNEMKAAGDDGIVVAASGVSPQETESYDGNGEETS